MRQGSGTRVTRSAALLFSHLIKMRRHPLLYALVFTSLAACSSTRDSATTDSVPTLRASTPDEVRAIRDSVAFAAITPSDSVADARAESSSVADRTRSMSSLRQCLAQLSPDLNPQNRKTIEEACRRAGALKSN